jgi:tetratricopeptide (TPR) repeat protein
MSKVRFPRILIALALITVTLVAQDIDEAIRLFNSYHFERSRAIFNEVVKDENNPRIAEAYYYLGRLSLAPDSAISYYRMVITKYPQSRYADVAHLEIAKIHFARKDFNNTIIILNQLLRTFPDTGAKDEVLFWLGVSYISNGNKEEGTRILQELRKTYPKSVWSERTLRVIPGAEPAVGQAYFTVQVGSYRDKKNAETFAGEIHNQGFDVQVVEAFVKGNTYFRVWVGKFASREDADTFSLKLDALGIKGNVVKSN